MLKVSAVNDLVVRFANVNGTGSASANNIFAKSIFRMGLPVSPKNIFPSNIQGLPTWYEVRISEKGYLGRRDGIDLMVAINPQSFAKDVASVRSGGYLLYDNTKKLYDEFLRDDIHFIGVPMTALCREHYTDPRHRQLFKNIVYLGAVATLINIEIQVIKDIISEQFERKPKLIPPNFKALELGINHIKENYDFPLSIQLERRDNVGDSIMIDGNAATALGSIYAGATFMAWYPITPSTSVAKAFEKYAKQLRVDPETGKNKFAIVQAEDELAAIGMVIGASWNGARSFTSTSGPGVSLMNEFIGLSYFAEIPAVLVNVQRGGPSTGMPTRTQQPDIISSAYASHGDTKHVMLFPSTPKECFEFAGKAFDLADRLQTLIFLMTDLDLGMNDHMSPPFEWDDAQQYDRGKVLSAEELEAGVEFGRYLDVDGDGVPYRTIPATHPTKGSFFTRGTSRDEYARYTEDGADYVRNVDRLLRKWDTAKTLVPAPEFYREQNDRPAGLIFFGTTTYAALEAMELLENEGILLDAMRVKAFPFHQDVADFVTQHETIYVVEQNRDAQFRTLLINELEVSPDRLVPILNYDGMPITADRIMKLIQEAQLIDA
ncbi:MAG: 2-oxoacid:acceptor oxidoreductase subunit alpha [Saprospiraceae bacterium]|nr:2-oxoacid:acceptor oxidoreductase subunit alpha [Saprospiraceae bacterium]